MLSCDWARLQTLGWPGVARAVFDARSGVACSIILIRNRNCILVKWSRFGVQQDNYPKTNFTANFLCGNRTN